MRKKYLATAALTLALAAGSAMTSFAAGFVITSQGMKYQWGSGDYCTNNWVNYKNHWFFFGADQIMRTGWIQKDGTWYYAADTGELQGGLMKINGNVYYFDNNSLKLQTGNRTINGSSHEFTENGTTDGGPYVYTEWNSNGTIRRGTKFGVVNRLHHHTTKNTSVACHQAQGYFYSSGKPSHLLPEPIQASQAFYPSKSDFS